MTSDVRHDPYALVRERGVESERRERERLFGNNVHDGQDPYVLVRILLVLYPLALC